jgi:hypothetical protein
MNAARGRWPIVVILLSVSAAVAAQVKVTPVVSQDGRVLASFSAPAAFSREAEHVMQSGLLLTFTFTVQLRRPAPLWFDATLAQTTVGSSVKYDSLTGVYQLTKQHDGKIVASERRTRAADVLPWMTAFDQVPLVVNRPLERNADYYVSVRLRTSPRPWLAFWSWGREDGNGRAGFTFIR